MKLIKEEFFYLSENDTKNILIEVYQDMRKFIPMKRDSALELKNTVKKILEDKTGLEVVFGDIYHANGIGNNKKWMIYLKDTTDENVIKNIKLSYLSIVNNMYGTEILSFLDPKTGSRYSYLSELPFSYRKYWKIF